MNQQDRAAIAKLQGELEAAKATVETIGAQLRELADAEQEKFDNLNEGLQAAESGQVIERNASTLDEAASAAEDGNAPEALEALENIE